MYPFQGPSSKKLTKPQISAMITRNCAIGAVSWAVVSAFSFSAHHWTLGFVFAACAFITAILFVVMLVVTRR